MLKAITIIGEHYWALMEDKLVVVLKTKEGYEVAGPWEGGVGSNEVKIISHISKPQQYKNTELYYE